MNSDFYQQIKSIKDSLPPVMNWNPPLSGNMDCLIKHDGSWWLDGELVKNNRLVRLFSTVLKREDNEYFLVTPHEKWHISVEDLPFMLVELTILNPKTKEQIIKARTNVGDTVTIGFEHIIDTSPITGFFDNQPIPFVHIRENLMARFNRNTHLELAELLEPLANTNQYQIISSSKTFQLDF